MENDKDLLYIDGNGYLCSIRISVAQNQTNIPECMCEYHPFEYIDESPDILMLVEPLRQTGHDESKHSMLLMFLKSFHIDNRPVSYMRRIGHRKRFNL